MTPATRATTGAGTATPGAAGRIGVGAGQGGGIDWRGWDGRGDRRRARRGLLGELVVDRPSRVRRPAAARALGSGRREIPLGAEV